MAEQDGARSGQDLLWLRITAAAIDVVVLGLIAQLAAVALYWGSDGVLRSSTFARTAHCQPMTKVAATLMQGVPAPGHARPVAAQTCVISSLGLESGRYVMVAVQSQEGEVVRSLAFSRPVNRQGAPVRPVILDWVWPVAFILAMTVSEWLAGSTIGKRLVGLKVVGAAGGRRLLAGAMVRNLAIWAGAALVIVAPLAAALSGLRLSQTEYYAAVGIFGLMVLAPIAMLIQAPARPLYDRWARTEVVRR